MGRAEFVTCSQRSAASDPAERCAAPAANPLASGRPAPLHILLIEEDAPAAAETRALLHSAFAERSVNDWVSDGDEGVALLAGNRHDICLLSERASGSAAAMLRAATGAGSTVPLIVLTPGGDPAAEAAVLQAGAADILPRTEATPAALDRAIRHALLRHARVLEAQRQIDELTVEKTHLNLLRDANHRFVENACHDFRSPLTVIKEFASIIAEGLAGEVGEEQAEFLEIILTRVDQLSEMVDGILDASRLESDLIAVKREEHAVAALVERVRPTLEQSAAARKAAIRFEIPDTLPKVFADAESVCRVITNLAANACKYAGEAGTVRVWARHDAGARQVTLGVTDSGPGIAPEHVKIIFDRFRQIPDDAERQKGGFGLGLHIASEFARINFGTLSVESAPGKGSTFSFTLPLFDIDTLIPLHLAFLRTSRHSFQRVTLAHASTAARGEAPLGEIEKVLNRQLRSYDLLMRLGPGSWLIALASDADAAQQKIDGILEAYAQASRYRPDGPLAELRFRPIGTWPLGIQPERVNAVLHGALPRVAG